MNLIVYPSLLPPSLCFDRVKNKMLMQWLRWESMQVKSHDHSTAISVDDGTVNDTASLTKGKWRNVTAAAH